MTSTHLPQCYAILFLLINNRYVSNYHTPIAINVVKLTAPDYILYIKN